MCKITKFLLPIFAATVGVIGIAGQSSALEIVDQTSNPNYQVYYNEAYATIQNYGYGDRAIGAYLEAVDEQIPEFANWKRIPYAMYQVQGMTRSTAEFTWNIVDGEEDHQWFFVTELSEALGSDDGDFKTLIDLAKNDAKYTSDATFRKLTDDSEAVYNYGMQSLRKYLPLVDPSAGNVATMTAEQLVAKAEQSSAYQKFGANSVGSITNLYNAYAHYMMENIIADSMNVCDLSYMSEIEQEEYAESVAVARLINPNFSVDLIGAQAACENTGENVTVAPAAAPTKKTPGVPDTGDQNQTDSSATVIAVALVSVATIATIFGAVNVARKYAFSPLRRK